jgi:putative oxidoreductase
VEQLWKSGVIAARILMSIVFLLNAVGIIDQTIPAKEMVERGVPAQLISWLMLAGRTVELIAGISLLLGVYPRLAALALLAFLVPATFVSRSFWLAFGTKAFQPQLINFSKNAALWGGLLFVAATSDQPEIAGLRDTKSRGASSVAPGGKAQV